MDRNWSDDCWQLLPRNSSPLERDILRTAPFLNLLDAPADSLAAAKWVNIDPSLLPYLVMEYGLGSFLAFQPDMAQLIVEGLAIQKIRGTPEAMRLAMLWLGLDVAVIEEQAGLHFAEYQLDIGELLLNRDLVVQIATLAKLVQPLRCRLRRLVNGWDVPMLRYDRGLTWDNTNWDNYSGVYAPTVMGADAPPVWLSTAYSYNGEAGPVIFTMFPYTPDGHTFDLLVVGDLEVIDGCIIDPTVSMLGDIRVDGYLLAD